MGKDYKDVFVNQFLCCRVVDLFVYFCRVHLPSKQLVSRGEGRGYVEVSTEGSPEDFFKDEGSGTGDDAGDVAHIDG